MGQASRWRFCGTIPAHLDPVLPPVSDLPRYQPQAIEQRWQASWERLELERTPDLSEPGGEPF